ncbi:MAG TPA: 5-oxoprolinase subunit PxpB [Mycobacteriales bacterium]|nr:5-oxoprolinase subunit PxpB [Mycobacteriales bacterium]
MGDRAFRIEAGSSERAHRIWAAIRAAAIPGVGEPVVGARSVLVHVDPEGCDLAELHRVVNAPDRLPGPRRRTVPLPVHYDGADLAEVAAAAGMSVEAVIRRHAAAEYTVAFLGFSPGFGYLVGLDPELQLPRRDTPRAAVPAGSVAIAGEFTAVYPQQTPGGWHLLGRTDVDVFDPHREPPALLAPGDTVCFTPA